MLSNPFFLFNTKCAVCVCVRKNVKTSSPFRKFKWENWTKWDERNFSLLCSASPASHNLSYNFCLWFACFQNFQIRYGKSLFALLQLPPLISSGTLSTGNRERYSCRVRHTRRICANEIKSREKFHPCSLQPGLFM